MAKKQTITEPTDHNQAVFESQLTGAVKVDYNALIESVENSLVHIKELARQGAKDGKPSKAGKEFIDEIEFKMMDLRKQANEWARTAFPNDYANERYSSDHAVFEKYEFTVLVSKKTGWQD